MPFKDKFLGILLSLCRASQFWCVGKKEEGNRTNLEKREKKKKNEDEEKREIDYFVIPESGPTRKKERNVRGKKGKEGRE